MTHSLQWAREATTVGDERRGRDATLVISGDSGTPGSSMPGAADHERYTLLHELARGGIGRVLLGYDRRLDREVAIKVLQECDPAAQVRFMREVSLAASLQHPGVVPIYDTGFLANGEPFIVMKRVLGRCLSDAIVDAETPDERLALLSVVSRVADAIAYAHDRGIVHRDLKPDNILVGALDEVHVIDWGLAKFVNESGEAAPFRQGRRDSSAGLTVQGTILGTPAYMAPEQARGGVVDKRADVYALGAIVYRLLSGLAPHDSAAPGGAVRREEDSVVIPLARLEPWVPADLLAVVEKAMAPEPGQRYPSAFEFAEDLDRYRKGCPVLARTYTGVERIRRLVAHNATVSLGAMTALALLAHAC